MARSALQGARLVFILNNVEVGWATGVTLDSPSQNVAVEVLGDLEPQEIVPVGRRYTLEAQLVQIQGELLETLGFFPDTLADVVALPGLTATIFDTITDAPLYACEGLRVSRNSVTIGARDVSRQNVSFEGTKIRRVS
jgi:hypothetical protein